jgi:hypothetical protein
MNTTINKAAIAGCADGTAGTNAEVRVNAAEIGGLRKTARDLQDECDDLKRYHKKEHDWVQLAVLPWTAVWEFQDGELKDFGNKLWEKVSMLVYTILIIVTTSWKRSQVSWHMSLITCHGTRQILKNWCAVNGFS